MLRHILGIAFVGALAALLNAASAQEMHAPARSTPAFDQLKSLAGEWQGKNTNGESVKLTYQVVSGGSALLERLRPANEGAEMVTMYTLDGDHIVVTHYCSAGNQPTMQTAAVSAATSRYEFHFVRAAGMKSPDEGHMVALTLSLADKDHLTQLWTFLDKGKSSTEMLTYTRSL